METKRIAMNAFRQDVSKIVIDVRDGRYTVVLSWWKEDSVVMMSVKEWERLKEIEKNANI